MKTRLLMAAISACLLAACASTQTASTSKAPSLPPVSNYSDFGPYPTVAEGNSGPDGTYTIVRPQILGRDGFRHAPIIFGPGIGGSMDSMADLLRRIASHGFVIIGRRLDGGPRNAENNRRMIAGLDWLIEQNSAAGSIFATNLTSGAQRRWATP